MYSARIRYTLLVWRPEGNDKKYAVRSADGTVTFYHYCNE
jgi:hypothetical protein